MAQFGQNRTTTTRIADLLAQVPAQNAKQLQKNAEEFAALGKPGIVQLISGLNPAGKGDNTALEFAIGGFTYYVNQTRQESWRKLAGEAYAEALSSLKDPENRSFLIFQLQQVAGEEAVTALSSCLKDAYLAGPAARALSRTGSQRAGQALLDALGQSSGAGSVPFLEALGDLRYAGAASAIEKLAGSSETDVRKAALYALANIGNPSSSGTLAEAARKVNFGFDVTNASDAYFTYLHRLAAGGNSGEVEKGAREILKTASVPVGSRTAALTLLAEAQPGDNTSFLIRSFQQSKEPQVRAALLRIAEKNTSPAAAGLWLTQLKQAPAELKAEIAGLLGRTRNTNALPALTGLLTSKNGAVKRAAINAIGSIGAESTIPSLLTALNTANAEELSVIKNALLLTKGNSLTGKIASAMPRANAGAKVVLLDVLAARGADDQSEVVFSQLTNKDAAVKAAAFSALKSVATAKHLPRLFTLLGSNSQAGEITALQEAVKTSLKGAGTTDQQTDLLLGQLNASANKASLLPVFAAVGGSKALNAVSTAVNSPDGTTKSAALQALSNWKDDAAAPELLTIARQPSDAAALDQAVKGYLKAVATSPKTPDQKVIMLREIAAAAQTAAQKEAVLKELQKYKTFNALLFAGTFLPDSQLEQAAAQAVMNIALANKDFNGSEVRTLLTRTMNLLKGGDAAYQKEAIRKHLAEMPAGDGFVSLFNGKDLAGWKGLVANPIARAKMGPDSVAMRQVKADESMRKGWIVQNGELIFTGKGENLCTVKQYGDFEMYVDWKIGPKGDAGIYLRGSPQVQIWDTSRVESGAQVGSGGLFNNQTHPSKPLVVADNPVGEWNTMYIKMIGDRVTVDLNGKRVVNNVILENYWDRKQPIFPIEQIELQAHGTLVAYRDIYVREIPRKEPFRLSEEEQKQDFKVLFDGTHMHHWVGNTTDYIIEDGDLVIRPTGKGNGNLYTKEEYSDFNFRFEFKLTPGANNGLGIRAPLQGDAAYMGMAEIQILDNDAEIYKKLQPYQYHGSVYGIIPAKRGYLKPVGEWNQQEVIVQGRRVKVILNGTVIVDGDVDEATRNGIPDKREHPGLKRNSGHIGFLGHGSVVSFRNIRIKDLTRKEEPAQAPQPDTKKKKKKEKRAKKK